MLARLRRVEDSIERVLLLGHNPGLQTLALALAKKAPSNLRKPLSRKFPTAALATYRLESGWAELAPGPAPLVSCETPAGPGGDRSPAPRTSRANGTVTGRWRSRAAASRRATTARAPAKERSIRRSIHSMPSGATCT